VVRVMRRVRVGTCNKNSTCAQNRKRGKSGKSGKSGKKGKRGKSGNM
jgi:hypothetical protein